MQRKSRRINLWNVPATEVPAPFRPHYARLPPSDVKHEPVPCDILPMHTTYAGGGSLGSKPYTSLMYVLQRGIRLTRPNAFAYKIDFLRLPSEAIATIQSEVAAFTISDRTIITSSL